MLLIGSRGCPQKLKVHWGCNLLLLKGGNQANLSRELSEKQQKALTQMMTELGNSFADRWTPTLPLSIVLNKEKRVMALLMQWDGQAKQPLKILELVFLPFNLNKSLTPRLEAIAKVVIKAWKWTLDISGMEPQSVLLLLTKEYLQRTLHNPDILQWALLNILGHVSSHFPPHKFFSLRQRVKELPWLLRQPVESLTVFTDASRRTSKAGLTWQDKGKWLSESLEGPRDSLQVLELRAVITVFEKWPKDPVDIVSDSLYAVGVVECMERAILKEIQNQQLWKLLSQLWQLLNSCKQDYFSTDIRSHSGLTEGLSLGNEKADQLVAPIWASASPGIDQFDQARKGHEFFS